MAVVFMQPSVSIVTSCSSVVAAYRARSDGAWLRCNRERVEKAGPFRSVHYRVPAPARAGTPPGASVSSLCRRCRLPRCASNPGGTSKPTRRAARSTGCSAGGSLSSQRAARNRARSNVRASRASTAVIANATAGLVSAARTGLQDVHREFAENLNGKQDGPSLVRSEASRSPLGSPPYNRRLFCPGTRTLWRPRPHPPPTSH
jgi:hypothetical protein